MDFPRRRPTYGTRDPNKLKERKMSKLYFYVLSLLKSEDGQDLAEYAILLALIALVVIVAVTFLGTNISTVFNSMANRLTSLGSS
jgi:pilus assembly protein Flp/PilA